MEKNSKYFSFKDLPKSIDNIEFFNYVGWSGLYVTKFLIPCGGKLTNLQLNNLFSDLNNKEKIFVTTKGNIEFKSDELDVRLNDLDAIDLLSEKKNYSFNSLNDSTIFMISSKGSKICKGDPVCFNFKKDLEPRDLWGGQIISRPYEGKELTVVLFDIKPGFKFEDKGHPNEQITWLIDGEMAFYSNGIKKKLTSDLAVSIGPHHIHGGVSEGAIGFDAFFPKRIEKKYKKDLKK